MTLHHIIIAQELPGKDPDISDIEIYASEVRPLTERLMEFGRLLRDGGRETTIVERRYFRGAIGKRLYYWAVLKVDRK
jgi:hypothetical protein